MSSAEARRTKAAVTKALVDLVICKVDVLPISFHVTVK